MLTYKRILSYSTIAHILFNSLLVTTLVSASHTVAVRLLPTISARMRIPAVQKFPSFKPRSIIMVGTSLIATIGCIKIYEKFVYLTQLKQTIFSANAKIDHVYQESQHIRQEVQKLKEKIDQGFTAIRHELKGANNNIEVIKASVATSNASLSNLTHKVQNIESKIEAIHNVVCKQVRPTDTEQRDVRTVRASPRM